MSFAATAGVIRAEMVKTLRIYFSYPIIVVFWAIFPMVQEACFLVSTSGCCKAAEMTEGDSPTIARSLSNWCNLSNAADLR